MAISKGLILAITAAGLFVSDLSSAAIIHAQEKPVKCFGINSCKGKTHCGTKDKNGCAGQNSCKGQGWLYLKNAEECKKRGGEVLR